MVFVSSFESKSGNAIQECARRIASLKFGEKNVPLLVNPHGLPTNDIQVTGREQVIISNIKFEDEVVQSEIQKFITHHMASGKGKKRKESTTNQETIKELLQLSKIKSNTIQTKPADLVFFDGDNWNIVEIKAGGDLDSSNAPGNVKKMLTLYVALNVPNAKLYFATIYHKTGEGTTWTGAVKQYLSYPDMFLIGSKFWEKILPEGIKFTDFCKIYGDAMKEIDLNKRLKTMIKDCLK
ncbi:MAG: TdeIII family type II restriction endonuclease [Caloramator sp.]|nr:TdeIII family type II restriction endonuclease [Caloramator sp.]